jgi:hypothetical protein
MLAGARPVCAGRAPFFNTCRVSFESTEQIKTWNGKKGSEVLNEGTYYYVAELMDCSNIVVPVKGTVYLKN